MKFTVCIKQVPDVASTTRLENGRIVQDTERMVLNAYDASALEECLVMREAHGGEIDVVLIGPERAAETIRKALAMGADQGHHIVVSGEDAYDSRVYATILAAYLRQNPSEVIAVGKQAQDTDSGLTGGMLATQLGLPYSTNAVALSLEPEALVVTRQGDSGREIVALPFPCLVTCSNDMNDPRIPSLKGIMQSKKKPITKLTLDDLNAGDEVDRAQSLSPRIVEYKNPPPRPAGKLFEGEAEELVAQLMSEL
jgi:electron transfer flavoprotein beta subunit